MTRKRDLVDQKSDRRRDKSWDLRVACALISLDLVDPFLAEMGFDHVTGAAARQAARSYVLDWRAREQGGPDEGGAVSEDMAESWLASVRERHGASIAERIDQLSDDLAIDGPNHGAWIELMVKLENVAALPSWPRLTRAKVAWLRNAARVYLAESEHISARVDSLGSAIHSPWDAELLKEQFYPSHGEGDTTVHFQPGPWLWAWLDKRHWQRFVKELRSSLSDQEIDELVSWGNGVIDSRWSLSPAL